MSAIGDLDKAYRDAYFAVWAEGRQREQWPNIAYWCVEPRWILYSDYDRGPLIIEY